MATASKSGAGRSYRHMPSWVRHLATIACVLFALGTATDAAVARGGASSARRRAATCKRRPGRTILRQGPVRIFAVRGGTGSSVYGCVKGSSRRSVLYMSNPDFSGKVDQVVGTYLVVESSESDQYRYTDAISVVELRRGGQYSIFNTAQPISGPPSYSPGTVEKYVLGPDGRTARLYDNTTVTPKMTCPTCSTSYAPTPTGQVLDLIGFQGSDRTLATSSPGGISPSSLAYDGHTVTWTEDGSPHSASV